MKPFTRVTFSLATSALLLFCMGAGVSAKSVEKPLTSEESIVHQLSTTPPVLSTTPSSSSIQPDGAYPPSSGASTHNLSVSPYNYQVQKVGYQVYTYWEVR